MGWAATNVISPYLFSSRSSPTETSYPWFWARPGPGEPWGPTGAIAPMWTLVWPMSSPWPSALATLCSSPSCSAWTPSTRPPHPTRMFHLAPPSLPAGELCMRVSRFSRGRWEWGWGAHHPPKVGQAHCQEARLLLRPLLTSPQDNENKAGATKTLSLRPPNPSEIRGLLKGGTLMSAWQLGARKHLPSHSFKKWG